MEPITDMTLGNHSLKTTLEIPEISISLVAKNLNPTLLNLDFLKFSGIIPTDWELARKPVINSRLAQLTFKSGVSIVAQVGTITFSEALKDKTPQQANVSVIARQYVEKLPNAEYQAVNISPKSLIAVGNGEDTARQYIVETLLAPGPWREFGQAPVRATISFFYQLERCQLSLNLNEVRLQRQNQSTLPALLFAGTFNYQLTQYKGNELVEQLVQRIDSWAKDLDTFREVVNKRFIEREDPIFPQGLIPPQGANI